MSARTAVIILNWNSGEMTAQCIRSLLAMNTNEYEIVVVDNGSHDNSVGSLRREFARITVLPQERNLGFAAGCNIGMQYAMKSGAEYVLLLNNDTVVDQNFLSALLEEAERHPKAGIISPKIYFWDFPNRLWWAGGAFNLWHGIPEHLGRKEEDKGQFDHSRELDWATGCAMLIRTALLQKVGLFDEQFWGNAEDLDLSLRARKAGNEIRFAPKAALWHKEGIDHRKNAGEHVRKFMGTRNLLWLMHKHATTIQWASFLPNFVFRHVLFYIFLSIYRGDARSARAVLEGIWAFLKMCANPASSPLPAALLASAKPPKALS